MRSACAEQVLGVDWRVWGGLLATVLLGALAAGALGMTLEAESPILWAGLALTALLTGSALQACAFTPWLPTRTRDLERVRELAALQPGERFCDLGCGDGRVVFHLARTTGARCFGVERSLLHYLCARVRWVLAGRPPCEVSWGDLFALDLSRADVVYVYATPTTIAARLREKLERELAPGARVIVYLHEVEGWTPSERREGQGDEKPLTLYRGKNTEKREP